MATDRPTGGVVFDGRSLRRRGDRRTDHISGLPDHLLHRILLGLPGGASAAARTSVLSRRWRRVWATLPNLLFRYTFDNDEPPPSSSSSPPADRVEAALAAYSAATVRRLDIAMPYGSRRRPSHPAAEHVSSWLRFASRRLSGELRLVVPWWCAFAPPKDDDDEVDVVLLPVCERVTSIHLVLGCYTLRFRPPTTIADAGGAFKALATLKISDACVDGPELEEMLSSRRCPCLKKLELERISLRQGGPPVLSLSSDSLEWLQIAIEYRGRLQVAAPNLRTFHGRSIPCEIYMAAPMLSEVSWHNNFGYDPSRHHLAVSGHHLRRLEIRADSSGLKLMRQFNIVDELLLTVRVMEGIQEYKRFLEGTDKLARCEVLVIRFMKMKHSFKSAMLHLLRQCPRVRKLVVQVTTNMDDYPCKLLSKCPCSLPENRKTKNMLSGLLEQVQVDDYGEARTTLELVRLLCKCSNIQKRVTITTISPEGTQSKYIGMKVIRSIVSPNTEVEITERRPGVYRIPSSESSLKN